MMNAWIHLWRSSRGGFVHGVMAVEADSAGGVQQKGYTGQGEGNWGAASADPVPWALGRLGELRSVLWDTTETRKSNSGLK